MTTWIVLAHRAGARVFQRTATGLALLETIEHPEGRLRDRDVDSDRPGVSYESSKPGGHPMRRFESASEHMAAGFAKQLAERLGTARREGAFHHLVLIAPPRFLGRLRKALDGPTAALVTQAVAKDLASASESEALIRVGELIGTDTTSRVAG